MVQADNDFPDYDRLIAAATGFQKQSHDGRKLSRKQYVAKEQPDDTALRILIDGLIAEVITRTSEKIHDNTPEIAYQLAATTSFVRSHFVITDMVLDGDLVEAATLIRKQLETLSRLIELDSLPLKKLTGKTPNVSAVLKQGHGKIYGLLSLIAHGSKPEFAHYLSIIEVGEKIGASLTPSFNEKNSRLCYDINSFLSLVFLRWLVLKLPKWYSWYDNKSDLELTFRAYLLAQRLDILRMG